MNSAFQPGLTRQLADFAVATAAEDISPDALEKGKLAILDCLGVTLAARDEPAGAIIAGYVRSLKGQGDAVIIGEGFRASASEAALVNGTLGHALDYDDTLAGMAMHPTVPVLPAVLALAESRHATGMELLAAFLIGVEVEARLGFAIGRGHYERGWHSTGVLGALGAAAGSSRLLGLDSKKAAMALGIAASQASGLRENFGTMTKPFHAGNAARAGVVASLLASDGFTSAENALEGPLGFAAVLTSTSDMAGASLRLGDPFAVLKPGLGIKPYPCCRVTHSSIDTTLKLGRDHNIPPDAVAAVRCLAGRSVPGQLPYHRPTGSLEAKFSLEYCVAVALLDRTVQIPQFEERRVNGRDVQTLLKSVEYVHPSDWSHSESARGVRSVTILMKDGTRYTGEVREPKGDPANPLSRDELAEKFRGCALKALPKRDVEHILKTVIDLEKLDDTARLSEFLLGRAKPSVR